MAKQNVCRCCLSETCYKDITNEYYHTGSREIYSEMLLNVFNIEISYLRDRRQLICEECIGKLQTAAEFKKQVLHSEAMLAKGLMNTVMRRDAEEILKQDIGDDFVDHMIGDFYDESSEHSDISDDDEWYNDGDLNYDNEDAEVFIIKLESKDSAKSLNQPSENDKKISESIEEMDFECVDNVSSSDHLLTDMDYVNEELNKKLDIPSKKDVFMKKNKIDKPISKSQMDMKENSLKLINNSNLCLFDSLKTKFRCFYCKDSFIHITDLRQHTMKHSNEKYLKMCINRLRGMSYKKVDISSLSCKICSAKVNDLTDLRAHLISEHKIEFTNEKHLLIPYKLENGFSCILCNEEYNTFFRLSIHMNSHYTNNVCEICGVSYINRISLRMHLHSMHREKKCSICSETFQNNYSRVKHMRKEHNSSVSKRYCLLCNKTFPYTYLLTEHMIQDHDAQRQVSQCGECGKSFLTPQNLRIHTRSVHIRERNHPCTYCGLRFFTKCDQKRHERTHQDIRSFACNLCEGRFKSKDSLRRHLKRQHDHIYTASES